MSVPNNFSSSDEGKPFRKSCEINSSSFYTKKDYLTPLERHELKRKYTNFACEDVTNSPKYNDGTNKKKKLSSKKNKSSCKTKENHRKEKENLKQNLRKSIEVTEKYIDPLAFLSKKVTSDTREKKFFKSRHSGLLQERLGPVRTCKSIIPMDIKASNALLHDRRKVLSEHHKQMDKSLSVAGENPLNVSKEKKVPSTTKNGLKIGNQSEHSDSREFNLKRRDLATLKWLENSFGDEKTEASIKPIDLKNISLSPSKPVDGLSETNCDVEDDQPQSDGVLEVSTSQKASNEQKLYSMFNPQKDEGHQNTINSASSKAVSKSSKKERVVSERDEKDQLMIDAGQKEIGAKQCPTCSMIYHVANVADENLHKKFHETYLINLKFQGWKRERVIGKFIDGRVIMITNEDPSFMLKKVHDVLFIVNRDLGFTNSSFPLRPNPTFLLFISLEKKVVGCLAAESITSAYRVEYNFESTSIVPHKDHDKNDEGAKVKAICGVNRLWVATENRRSKIATRMLDCLRCNFCYGCLIEVGQLAFLDPTVDGRKFASAYCGNKDFLVYK